MPKGAVRGSHECSWPPLGSERCFGSCGQELHKLSELSALHKVHLPCQWSVQGGAAVQSVSRSRGARPAGPVLGVTDSLRHDIQQILEGPVEEANASSQAELTT